MGGQLREPMTLGFIMRSIGMTLLSVVKTLVPGGGKLHHSFGSSSERPHIAFPFRQAVAAMVITKENEKMPVLGGDIVESPIQRKQRRSGVVPEWNLTNTYTFAMHTPYVTSLSVFTISLSLSLSHHTSSMTFAFNSSLKIVDNGEEA